MSPEPEPLPTAVDIPRLIAQARQGDREALNVLMEECRAYLLTLANRELGAALRPRVSPSDLVQETMHKACEGFPDFCGQTEQEWLGWLRRILLNRLANEHDHHTAGKRDVGREVPLAEVQPADLRTGIVDPAKSPSEQAELREWDEALERGLQQLPEDHRQALLLRTRDGLTFAQVGERLGRTEEAARKLFARAAEKLAAILGGPP